ncbi:type II toxin-antitoxin system VapC family toxin [Mucilaginibacter psychrotolerans]|uniref:type II toxin-antitoxin system VapC family toxin n=1 Tax=Mucilaginibacter psychrotolerans TaxID=1524096 RepID=UPI0013050780
MIFDTNILIYISKNILRIDELIPPASNAKISVISYIEAMGFAFGSAKGRNYMAQVCSSCEIVELSDEITKQTIQLRASHKIKLPDAIIYSTALVENLPLLTNNISDFKSLPHKVELINPFNL